MKKLKGKIALITGASKGIGAAVAKRYAAEGAHVILVAKTISGLEETDDVIKAMGGEATLVPLNLLEYNKIDELGGIISQRFGKLDILVGNAAILGVLSPTSHITPSVFEKTIATNLTVNFRLIRSFDLLLRQSEAGRALFVTSGVTNHAAPFWGAYAASKAALESLVKNYAAELANTKVRANLIDPGVVRTSMRAEAMPGENPLTLPTPDEITDVFVKLACADFVGNGEVVAA
jgi:NAD(P)-dependent dehydrogenase (short-subunit alcohol dehydrogenase family)